MADAFLTGMAGGGLGCVYFSMLAVGVLYALVILIGGGAGEGAAHVGPADLGVGMADGVHGEMDVAHVSPVTIAGFVTAFGAFGSLALNLFGATGPISLVWASAGGLLVGVASHVAFYSFLIKPQGSSEVTLRDILGARGEVITSIPGDGLGEVALVAQGGRVVMSARSADGTPIGRGTIVRIEDRVGSVALVRPAGSGPAES